MMDEISSSNTPTDTSSDQPIETTSIEEEMSRTFDQIEAGEPIQAETAGEARARDEAGRFAAKPAVDPAAPPVKADTPPAPVDTGAPSTFRPAAKAAWANTPQEVKDEIYKREQDAMQGVTMYKARAEVGNQLMGVITPYKPIMAAHGVDIPTALNDILQSASVLYVGTPAQKASLIRNLVQQHGIDIGELGGNAPAADQFVDPALDAVRKELAEVKGALAKQSTSAQHSEEQAAMGEITAFQNDPSNKYFNDVAGIMGELIERGRAATMKEAYNKACLIHDDVRAAMLIENRNKSQAETAERARNARRAGALSTRTIPTPVPLTQATGNWQDGLDATYDAIVSRSAA